MPTQPYARDCQHGQLARSCDRCADAAEIEELKTLLFARAVTIRALEDERDRIRAEVEALRRGECICKSCGLRQPGEPTGPVPF